MSSVGRVLDRSNPLYRADRRHDHERSTAFDGLHHSCRRCQALAGDGQLIIELDPTDGEIYFVHRGPC